MPDTNAVKQRHAYRVLTQEDIHPAYGFHTTFMPSRRPSLPIFSHVQDFKMPLEHVLRCVSVPLRRRTHSDTAWQPLALHIAHLAENSSSHQSVNPNVAT